MPRKEVFVCDRCQKLAVGYAEASDQNYITLRIDYTWVSSQFSSNNTAREALWCGDCVKAVNVFVPLQTRNDETKAPGPTFEDLLREICREEAEAAVDRRYDNN